MTPEITQKLIEKRYLVFAPQSARDLRVQYPELSDYPEFKSGSIKSGDLLFVWWFRNATSPYHDFPDEEKLEWCIKAAYKSEQQRDIKLAEFSSGFPDNVKKAFRRMESFNTGARVENYLYTLQVRENCKTILAADAENMDPDEQEAWAKRAPAIWRLMEDTSKALERGAFGVAEYDNTTVDDDDGAVRAFRQSNK